MKEFEMRQRAAYHTVAEARRIGTRTRVFHQKSNNRFFSFYLFFPIESRIYKIIL